MATKRFLPTLQLHLTEASGHVQLQLVDGETTILDFENAKAPSVRVVGFNDRHHKEQAIADFIAREATDFGSELQALNALINSHERQAYNKTLLLRREARKLAMIGRTLSVAKKVRARLQDRKAQ